MNTYMCIHSVTGSRRCLSVDPRFPGRNGGTGGFQVLLGTGIFCALMYVCYFKEYEDKQSVAEYLKSDQLKEDAKRIHSIVNKNNK